MTTKPEDAPQELDPNPAFAADLQSGVKREGLCEICDREYRVWAAASPLWNAVVRGGSINGDEEFNYLCSNCFMGLAEDRGIASLFQVRAAQSVPLETVTPTGRVWNDAGFRFE